MLTIDLYNPTGKTASRALLGLLRKAFQRRYAIIRSGGNRTPHPRHGVIEAHLYSDGSGLEIAFGGWWRMFGVETKPGYVDYLTMRKK